MRGYSLHDLYAKGLALLGLGMLAGTGALMDYWPSEGGSLPMPAAPSVSVPIPTRTLASAGVIAVPDARVPAPRRTSVRRVSVVEAPLAAPPSAPMVLPPSGSLGVNVPLSVLESASVPETADGPLVASEPVTLVASETALPAAYALVEHQSAPVSRAIDESESGGLVSGVFRKTGNSLRKTGAKTGSSIVGAIRGFGGAFSGAVRRALPVI